ncbi:spore germination protein [Clostridiaceae bacterium UIB06]|nr:spore germination protein [Clostridiaceae bacterium UIB06]
MDTDKSLSICLCDNLAELNNRFKDCPDVIQKQVILKDMKKGCFVFIKNFISIDLLQRDFIRPLLSVDYALLSNKNIVNYLPALNASVCYDIDTTVTSILLGEIIFLIDGVDFAITCDLTNTEKRSIKEPDGEKNVRSPHDGFIESIDTNIMMLREKIKNNNLKFKIMTLGNITNQRVAIAYIEAISNPNLLNTFYTKIKGINVDGLLSVGQVEQLISDYQYSPFPEYLATERPDKVVAALLEGRFIVLLEGTPYSLIAPVSIFDFFQAPDDYSSNWIAGTTMRLIRIVGIVIALLLPSLYISVTTFHYYLVPLNILVQLAQSRVKVAFPPIVEAFLMALTIEMLREASIRLPTYIGTTIGVVGGIIIGQASVNAGVVSNLFIIIVAVTAIASYVVPNYEFGLTIILLRFILLVMSSFFGIIGVIVGIVYIIIHLLSLESLGQPYLMPIMPLKLGDLKDAFVRLPMKFMKKRPSIAQPVNKERGSKNE